LTQQRQAIIVPTVKVRGETPDPLRIYTSPEGFNAFEIIRVLASPDLPGEPPCDVELKAAIEKGRYVVSEVRCTRRPRGPEITGELVRRIRVADILLAGALAANKFLAGPPGNPAALRAQGPTEESLRVAARVYRMAHLVRDNPTGAVASAIGLPHSTAARWVQQARQAGFLGPAEPRRAGETSRPRRS
jgi:hypothetical protein